MQLPTIELPWYKTSLYSANARLHWAKRAKLVKVQRAETDAAARQAGWHLVNIPADAEIHYTITVSPPPRVWACDDDNILTACKGARDQLAEVLDIDDKRFRFKGLDWAERSKTGYTQIRATVVTPADPDALDFLFE